MTPTMIELFHPVCLAEMETAALEVLRSGQISSGSYVGALELAFAKVAGREHIVSTNDFSSAMLLALYLAGVRAGDEVATIAFSCLQSNSPIANLGARPVWIDIDPATMSMSVEDLAAKLTQSVKAVIVYHIAGYPSETESIAKLCSERGIALIEDCNNAIGAELGGRPVGLIGDYAVYSLYPNRQINGVDGGLLATPDLASAERATRLRRFGIDAHTFRDARGEINKNSDVSEIGWSFALNNLNAAIALSQLNTLSNRIKHTRSVADLLTSALGGLSKIRVVQHIKNAIPAFWGFFILCEQRDALLDYLKSHRIKSSVFHHRNDLYTGFGTPRADLPGTELVVNQLLALPCGWWMTKDQVRELIFFVTEFDSLNSCN